MTYNFVNPIILVSGYDKNITDVLYQVVNYIEDFEFESLGEFHHHMGGLLGMYIGVLKVILCYRDIKKQENLRNSLVLPGVTKL